MTNLKLLIKNNINMFIGSFQNKTKRKSFISASVTLIVGCLGLLAIYTLQANYMFIGLGRELGLYDLCMFHSFTTSLSVLFIIGIMRVSDKQKTNDSDLLLSLPIKKSEIIISKTLVKYVFDFFFVFLLFTPYLVLYQVYTGFSILTTLVGTIYLFLLPLLSIAISNIWSFVVSHLFNKTKYAGFLKSLVTLIAFILVMGLLLIKTSFYGTVQFESLTDYFADRPLTNMFLNAVLKHDLVSNLILICIIVVPFIIGLLLYSLSFGKTHLSYVSKTENLKITANKNSFSSMLKKELNYYCNTPAYLINTLIGPVLSLVLSIIVLTMGKNGLTALFGIMLPQETLVSIITLVLCGCCALTTISCSSISLEGKNFWVLKSSPISERTLFLSKATLNIVMLCPFIIVSAILFAISLKLSFVYIILIITLPILMSVIISFGGLLINLYLPKLKWDNETVAVKQSLSVLLTMIFGLLLTALPVGVYYLFSSISLVGVALVSILIYLILICLVLLILFTKGVELFRKIKC